MTTKNKYIIAGPNKHQKKAVQKHFKSIGKYNYIRISKKHVKSRFYPCIHT